MIYGLEDDVIARIRAVLARYPQVDKALIYGSRALGTGRPGSDIDLALFGKHIDLQLVNRISNDLDDLMLP
ncbi:MAG: nucleotidyltransferase domain-containing protein, partial [Deltaproteobacteria bacterium]